MLVQCCTLCCNIVILSSFVYFPPVVCLGDVWGMGGFVGGSMAPIIRYGKVSAGIVCMSSLSKTQSRSVSSLLIVLTLPFCALNFSPGRFFANSSFSVSLVILVGSTSFSAELQRSLSPRSCGVRSSLLVSSSLSHCSSSLGFCVSVGS